MPMHSTNSTTRTVRVRLRVVHVLLRRPPLPLGLTDSPIAPDGIATPSEGPDRHTCRLLNVTRAGGRRRDIVARVPRCQRFVVERFDLRAIACLLGVGYAFI